ncbi:MAG: hypothetical protein KDE48_14010 [Anaerolineales bacterium]|nr:hypothetical protein [Anaerolineales bacterium]
MATYPHPPSNNSGFEPSPSQLERDAELRRFNRLYIFLPLGAALFIAVILMAILIIGVFAVGSAQNLIFVSALADIIIILGILPLLLIVAILPIGYFGYKINQRQKRKLNPQTGPLAYRSRIQIFMWRLDQFAQKLQNKTNETAPRVAKPIMKANETIAYLEAWPKSLKKTLKRSDKDDTRSTDRGASKRPNDRE